MARANRSEGASGTTRSAPPQGVLYVVATPIGNLEDLSPRARRTLHSVSLIAAEDTRRLRSLAGPEGFRARLVSMPAPREAERVATVIGHLAAGRCAAVVTDAGTPVLSDPGARLVGAARDAGFRVVPIPGPSAATAALAAAGFGGAGFLFVGFLPLRGAHRRQVLAEISRSPRTVVLFEAPQRLARTLSNLRDYCGDARRVVVARELTKIHEEVLGGTLSDLIARLPDHLRGEVTLVLEGATPALDRPTADPGLPDSSLVGLIEELLRSGLSVSRASREAARRLGCDRRQAYQAALTVQAGSGTDS